MSGRHRKPTTSSFSVAKIAVTGAVLGGSSLGLAAAAQAATDSEWDIVASCESSGNWAINTGNGYHGGLQFSPSTWLGYGGGQFASAAHYGHPRRSRSRSPRRCSPDRARAPGRCAAAGCPARRRAT